MVCQRRPSTWSDSPLKSDKCVWNKLSGSACYDIVGDITLGNGVISVAFVPFWWRQTRGIIPQCRCLPPSPAPAHTKGVSCWNEIVSPFFAFSPLKSLGDSSCPGLTSDQVLARGPRWCGQWLTNGPDLTVLICRSSLGASQPRPPSWYMRLCAGQSAAETLCVSTACWALIAGEVVRLTFFFFNWLISIHVGIGVENN